MIAKYWKVHINNFDCFIDFLYKEYKYFSNFDLYHFKSYYVDDLSRAWYGDDCIGTAYIRHATTFEIEWYKRITNPRKTKLLKLDETK